MEAVHVLEMASGDALLEKNIPPRQFFQIIAKSKH
jgi:hypothetical protein